MRKNVAWIFKGNDLIPVSHRDPLVYLEASKVTIDDGRVVYWASQRGTATEYAFNFPALNTAVLLLGPGCSITSDAVEILCAANVVIGFTGSGGSHCMVALRLPISTSRPERQNTVQRNTCRDGYLCGWTPENGWVLPSRY